MSAQEITQGTSFSLYGNLCTALLQIMVDVISLIPQKCKSDIRDKLYSYKTTMNASIVFAVVRPRSGSRIIVPLSIILQYSRLA